MPATEFDKKVCKLQEAFFPAAERLKGRTLSTEERRDSYRPHS